MDKLNIKVSLANRMYPMTIDSKEEKLIRLSVSKIDKKIKLLKSKYSVKDDQDVLAMCALQLCVKLEKVLLNKTSVDEKIMHNIIDMKRSLTDLI